MRLLLTFCDKKYSVHRANTRKVKNFIQSFGNKAKTDALDAKALAMYEGRKLRQENLHRKISTLTSSLSICNTTRRIHMRRLSKVKNPLSDPDIAASYARIAGTLEGLPPRKGPPITAESELEQWNLLCKRCATELQKAQQELVQLLNFQAR